MKGLNLISKSACELITMIKKKDICAIEVAQAFIDRIVQINPALNAIHDFEPKRILEQAHHADKVLARGDRLGALHGLPISLKDTFYAPGFRGSKGNIGLLKSSPVNKCATIVKRLLDEGAIILGITNVPEFVASFETDNLIYGRTNNPYNLNLTPGGSSGGEAALIAAGGSPLGVGSDGAGSIRQPAHCCGISGFKPSPGMIPITGCTPTDVSGMFRKLFSYGPMARHVEDLVLAFSVMRGPDGYDPDALPKDFFEPSLVQINQLRIAFFTDNGLVRPNEEIVAAIRKAVFQLREHVASIDEKTPKFIEQSFELLYGTFFYNGDEGATLNKKFEKNAQNQFSPLYQSFLANARKSKYSVTELKQRFTDIDKLRIEMFRFMQDYDILICPVAASLARAHGTTYENIKDFSYTMTFNLTEWPVTVIPCGFSQEGLPIGIQIAAKPLQDNVSLAAAQAFQKILGVLPLVNIANSDQSSLAVVNKL